MAAVGFVRFVAKECGIVWVDGGVTVVVRDDRRVSGECVIGIDGRFEAKGGGRARVILTFPMITNRVSIERQ